MDKEATWYSKTGDGKVVCELCPHRCELEEGRTGICRVRSNRGGRLVAETYGLISALHLDPIEKKPLYHFFPGSQILSAGSVGCNLRCRFCQNCEISQSGVSGVPFIETVTADELVLTAKKNSNNIGIAYTYNEPVIWYEYILEVASKARAAGLKNVMVTNGFINAGPLSRLTAVIDAFSVDLKGFDGVFYRKITSSSLSPVLKSLRQIKQSGRHLEIVNLVIPGQNDDIGTFNRMVQWIYEELGRDMVLHLSAYFPRYHASEPPTPPATLLKMQESASKFLDFVYVGNLASGSNNTYCPSCRQLLVERTGYRVYRTGIEEHGNCRKCGEKVFLNY